MILTRSFVTKLTSTLLHMSCLYAVYRALINSLEGSSIPYVYLLPGYIAAALLYVAGGYMIPSKRLIRLGGLFLGLIYATVLILTLTSYSPLTWILDQHETMMQFPIQFFKSKCNVLSMVSLGTVLWFLGWRQARLPIDSGRIFSEFQMGFSILFFVIAISHGYKIHVEGLTQIVGIFFLLGLSGIILSRKDTITVSDHPTLSRQILLYSMCGIALIFLLGLLVATLVNPDLIAKILWVGTWFKHLLLRFIDMIMNLIPLKEPLVHPQIKSAEMFMEGHTQSAAKASSANTTREIATFIYGLICSGAILCVLWRMSVSIASFIKNFHFNTRPMNVESMDGAFKKDVLQWIIQSWRRFKILLVSLMAYIRGILPHWMVFAHVPPKPLILAMYEKLLTWSKKNGYQRTADQTASEHLTKITHVAPHTEKHATFITLNYEKHRYGHIDLSPSDDVNVHHAWQRLKKMKI